MCGLLAIISDSFCIEQETLKAAPRMVARMESRGPDGRGHLHQQNVWLGHRRLAIRDVAGGYQPMSTNDGRFTVVYNGELYNDNELRARLVRDYGIKFHTTCDTETLLQAFASWGENCVEHLDGMFAFVAIDFQKRKAVVVRDRFGIKPLFYSRIGSEWIFASSVAAISEHPRVTSRVDPVVLSHYLSTFRTTLGERTMLADVRQVRPAERWIIQNDSVHRSQYWHLPEIGSSKASFDDTSARFEHQFPSAVRRRWVSDKPVGMMLSGGVDSAAIALIQKERNHENQNVKPLAIVAGEEATNAKATAEATCLEFDVVDPDASSYWRAWHELTSQTGLPCSTPSDPIIFLLAERLKKSVDVALGGEGADELLCGYLPHHAMMMGVQGRSDATTCLHQYYRTSALFSAESKSQLLNPWFWKQCENDQSILDEYGRDAVDAEGNPRQGSSAIYHCIHRLNLEGQLTRLDAATMAASLEARVPFTDRQLCESMSPVALSLHINALEESSNGETAWQTKRILRGWLSKSLPVIAQRPKRSFPTPVMSYLTGIWNEKCRETIAQSDWLSEVFRPEVLAASIADPNAAGLLLWPMMNLALWQKAISEKSNDSRAAHPSRIA